MPRVLNHPWLTFASLSLLFFWVSAGTFSSLGVVLPAMVRELHWNWKQAGMGYTVLGVACGLTSFLPAVLIRRIGVRATLLGGSIFLAGGFAVLSAANSVWGYLLGTLIVGMAFALTSTVPGTHVLTGQFSRRSTVLGAYFTIGALGGVAGPLIYLAVQALGFGWRAYWVVFAATAIVLGVFAIATTPGKQPDDPGAEVPPEQSGPVEIIQGLRDWTVRHALRTPQYYVVVGAYTMYLLINTTAHGFAVEHLTERGISLKAAAAMLSIEALIGAAVSSIGGVIGEKVSPKALLLVAMVGVTVGMWGLAEAHGIVLMSVYAVGVGVGFGLSFVASTMLLLTYFGKKANLELYSIMCLISTAAAIGPALGGWARDALGDFVGMFQLCAAAAFVMLIASIFLKPPAHFADTVPDALPESQA